MAPIAELVSPNKILDPSSESGLVTLRVIISLSKILGKYSNYRPLKVENGQVMLENVHYYYISFT